MSGGKRRRPLVRAAAAGLAVAAAWASLSVVTTVDSARAEVGPGQCSFATHADADLVNIAYPDSSAQYWATEIPLVPGVTIHGHFPHSRYFSFNAYEGSLPIGVLTDHQIRPDPGSVNPFARGAPLAKFGGTYTIVVTGDSRPSRPAPNTLYAGRGENGEPVPAVVVLYRVYVGADSAGHADPAGGVPLPTVSYAAPGPALPADCSGLQPSTGGSVNAAVARSSDPYDSSASSPTVESWGVSNSAPTAKQAGPLTVYSSSPFFPNLDNDYLSLLVWKNAGDLVVIRMKAPTFPSLPAPVGVMPSGYDLRYWSFCTNDFPSNRYVACLPDHAVKVDRQGYVNLIVSDVAHRPTLGPTDNWLAAGPYPDIFLLYRNMLPGPGFTHAVQDVPVGASPARIRSVLGPYYPDAVMCTVAQFRHNRCGVPES